MSKITILGAGAMGSRMAINLLKHRHEVTLWNRDSSKLFPLIKKGAKSATSPRSAVKEAEYVISMVRDNEASHNVWLGKENGALVGMSQEAIAIESSTLTVEWAKELASHCRSQGIAFLDAPVAGGRAQAEAAQLIYFVGGETSMFERARPLLLAMGTAAHHIGPSGSGAAVKLMGNALFGIQLATMGELIGFVRRLGFDDAKAMDALASTRFCSTAASFASKAMLKGNFAPQFPLDLVAKDFAYVMQTAASNMTDVPMAESARNVFARAVEAGYGQDNITGVAQLYQ